MNDFADEKLSEYEFKIIRGLGTPFRKKEILKRLCEEEKLAGWELFEKLDDQRVRFKRPISARKNDNQLKFEAYRTQVGWLNRTPSFIFPLILVFFFILAAVLIFSISRPIEEFSETTAIESSYPDDLSVGPEN